MYHNVSVFLFTEQRRCAHTCLTVTGSGACAAMADRRSTVRINAERLRASLKAGLGEEEPAAADDTTDADRAMDRAIAGLSVVGEKLKTFDLNVAIGSEVAKEVGAAMGNMGIMDELERADLRGALTAAVQGLLPIPEETSEEEMPQAEELQAANAAAIVDEVVPVFQEKLRASVAAAILSKRRILMDIANVSAGKLTADIIQDKRIQLDGIETELRGYANDVEKAAEAIRKVSSSNPMSERDDGSIAAYDKEEAKILDHMRGCYAELEKLLVRREELTDYKGMVEALDELYSKKKSLQAQRKKVPEQLIQDLKSSNESFPELTEDSVTQELKRTKERAERCEMHIRDVVLKAYGTTKGGLPEKERTMEGDDFTELAELKLDSKAKSSRSRVKGKRMMQCIRKAILLKPTAMCALAPAFAAYEKVCISMSKFTLPTADRLDKLSESEMMERWGIGKETALLFMEQTVDFYNAMSSNKDMGDVLDTSTRPDHDFDPSFRGVKPDVQGVFEDIMSYVELWRTQQEFLSDTEMEVTRNRVKEIRAIWYKMTIEKAVPLAQKVIKEAQELETRVSWERTGKLWIECLGALQPDLKADFRDKQLHICPPGVNQFDCINMLPGLLADIESIAKRNAKLQDSPAQLSPDHELFYTESSLTLTAALAAEKPTPAVIPQHGDKTAKAICQVENCGHGLAGQEFNEHCQRVERSKGKGVCKAICRKHYNQALDKVKKGQYTGLKWTDGSWVGKSQLFISNTQLRKMEWSARGELRAAQAPSPEPAPAPAPAPSQEGPPQEVEEQSAKSDPPVANAGSMDQTVAMLTAMHESITAQNERMHKMDQVLSNFVKHQEAEPGMAGTANDHDIYKAGREAGLQEASDAIIKKASFSFTVPKPANRND